jgi:outer membrane lipoprotein SlyB
MAGLLRTFAPFAMAIILGIAGLVPALAAQTQKRAPVKKAAPRKQPPTPFSQGYQKGYTDGFAQGEADWGSSARRDFRRSDKWQQRDAGSSEEYGQGYELGFELAYSDGYYGRTRNAVVPRNAEVLAKAATLADQQRARRAEDDRGQRDANRPGDNRPSDSRSGNADRQGDSTRRPSGPVNIPNGTELRIRLSTPISTKDGRVGDKFKATVVTPSTYETATVEGHISTLNKSGRVSGKTEVGLAFDSLTLSDGRQTRIDADLVKIYESENVKKVDEEGRIETGSRTRDTEVRGGVGAAAGAIIGGIVGGGKGAIIGAIVGGAAGAGSIYVEGNKDLILDPGTEMVIRTVGPKER